MNNLVQKFLLESSFNTQKAYLKAITTYFGTDNITITILEQQTSPKDIKNYISSMSKLAPATIEQRLSALSSFIDFINYYEETDIKNNFKNPYLTKNLKTKKDKVIEILTHEEIDKFLSVINNNRNHILFKTLLNTGMRESEVVNLKPSDIININNKWFIRIHAINAKNNCHRDIEISNCLKTHLDSIIVDKSKIFKLSTGHIWRLSKKYAQLASITKNVHPHIFRHTAISHIIEKGATLQEAQRFAGHKSIKMTIYYFHELDAHKNTVVLNF